MGGVLTDHPVGHLVAAVISFSVGAAAASSLFYGCILLVRETRLALLSLSEETAVLETRINGPN